MRSRQNWHDALDQKVGLKRFYDSPNGKAWARGAYRMEGENLQEPTKKLLRSMISAELQFAGNGTPYFVSREMCAVVESAAPMFQPEPIFPTDFLTMEGFLLFEKPFMIPDRYDRPVQVSGFGWRPMVGYDSATDLNEALTRLASREDELREWIDEQARTDRFQAGLVITLYQPSEGRDKVPGAPGVIPLHFTPWYWGMTFEGNEVDEDGKPSGAIWWWRILQTTLRLMQQTITTRYHLQAPRPSRREAQRFGASLDDTVVVRLRREKHPTDEGHVPEEANYSHRFVVRGHWRNQWYPSENVHRQIWIADFIKGDESLPLVIKPRAYNWSR